MVKYPVANAGDVGSVPGSGRSLGGGNGNRLECSWSLAGYSPWSLTESDMTERLNNQVNSQF